MEKYSIIVDNLKRGSSTQDKELFKKWEEKEISDVKCLKAFKENNDIDFKIPLDLFIEWLGTIGWKK